MKEQGFTFAGLNKGLRLREKASKDDNSLEVCYNLVPKPEGLVPIPIISEPITSISASHPFPQIFFGDSFWLLCTEDKIYTINADWTVTLAIDVSPYYGTFPTAPKGVWHFEDFFDFVLLTNGGVTVLYNTLTSQWEYNDGTTIPTLGSVCNFNGQIFGIGVTDIAGDSKTSFQGTDKRFIMWGGIGSANFVIDKSNVKGNMALVGEQYKCMKLGDYVVVYGSRKITILKPEGVNYGVVRQYNYGIASRSAVGGDDKNHCFIDAFGNYYHIDSQLKVIGPNYKEFFEAMLGNEIVVQHLELDNEFFITDGVVSYMRSDEGIGEIGKAYTGVGILGANKVGVATDLGDTSAYYTTSSQVFGAAASKTVVGVSVVCDASTDVFVAVESRNNRTESFVSTEWVAINPSGYATITIKGAEHKIKVKCANGSDFNPDIMVIRVKFDDKRDIRGKTDVSATYRGASQ